MRVLGWVWTNLDLLRRVQERVLLRCWGHAYFNFNSRGCCWFGFAKVDFLNLTEALVLMWPKWALIPLRWFTNHWLHAWQRRTSYGLLMNCVWTWCPNSPLILAGTNHRSGYLWSLNLILCEYQLFSHIGGHLRDHIGLHNHPPVLLVILFVLLLHLWLILMLLIRHIIIVRHERWIAVMMLVMNPGAPQFGCITMTSSTYLILQRGRRLGLELDAGDVPYHDQVPRVCRLSLEEHGLLPGWRGIRIVRWKLHQAFVANDGGLHDLWLMNQAVLRATAWHQCSGVERFETPSP